MSEEDEAEVAMDGQVRLDVARSRFAYETSTGYRLRYAHIAVVADAMTSAGITFEDNFDGVWNEVVDEDAL